MSEKLIERVNAYARAGALKRDPQRAEGKAPHNQARFLLNAVIEADKHSGEPLHRTAQDLLQVALLLSRDLK
jgi:hypothetical protein